MTEAGFDPAATVSFWNKREELERKIRLASSNEQKAECFSTHPHVSLDPPLTIIHLTGHGGQSESRIDRAARGVPGVLYLTGKASLLVRLSFRQARKLRKQKRRWEEFLLARPSQVSG